MPAITKKPNPTTRLRWRVVVGTQGLDPSRPSRPLSWHLAECRSALLAEAHCPRGRLLLAEGADPDGHCWNEADASCPRCANLLAIAALLEAPPPPSAPAPIPASIPVPAPESVTPN